MAELGNLTIRQLDVYLVFLTHWSDYKASPSRAEIAEQALPNEDDEPISETRVGAILDTLEKRGFVCIPEPATNRDRHKSRAYPSVGIDRDTLTSEIESARAAFKAKEAEARRNAHRNAKPSRPAGKKGGQAFQNERAMI